MSHVRSPQILRTNQLPAHLKRLWQKLKGLILIQHPKAQAVATQIVFLNV
jgi:hypothetical protein